MEFPRIKQRLRIAGAQEFDQDRRLIRLRQLSAIYEYQGVLGPVSAPALHDCCPDAAGCWASLPPHSKPSSTDRWGYARDRAGSIAWPWVGKNYALGGVAVIGLNFRFSDDGGTVALEYLAAQNDLKQFHEDRKRSRFGSAYPYCSTASAAAVCASLDRESLVELPAPSSLASTLERICRLQLVKCTPGDHVVDRGSPSATMCQRCPHRFLVKELDVLQPTAIIGFGMEVYRALDSWPKLRWESGSDHLCRGTMRLAKRTATVFWLPHPSSSGWPRGQRALIRRLRAKRVSPGASD
jgi:hypothetical protein